MFKVEIETDKNPLFCKPKEYYYPTIPTIATVRCSRGWLCTNNHEFAASTTRGGSTDAFGLQFVP